MTELLYKRRSVRKYKPDAVENEKIEILKKSLLLSPSGKNKKPWRFIIIKDKNLIRKAAEAKPHGTTPLETAPLAIAVTGLTDKSDVWIEDCSIASIILQLAAESADLSSCWVQIRKRLREDGSSSADWLAKLFKLKENETVLALIAIGYADEKIAPHTDAELDFSRFEEL